MDNKERKQRTSRIKYYTVTDIRHRYIDTFTKEQTERFFSLQWGTLLAFIRNQRPIRGLYYLKEQKSFINDS